MLAKLTSKNQLTLPKAVVDLFPRTSYFEVTEDAGRIVLTPVRLNELEAVQRKFAEAGLTEEDVRKAVRWARGRS